MPAVTSGGPPRARGQSCRSPRARAGCGTLPPGSCASSSSPPHPGAQNHSATARAAVASMKRARIAFMFPSCRCDALPATGRPSVSRKVPGFASPPRGGFALDESRIGQRPSLPHRKLRSGSGSNNGTQVPANGRLDQPVVPVPSAPIDGAVGDSGSAPSGGAELDAAATDGAGEPGAAGTATAPPSRALTAPPSRPPPRGRGPHRIAVASPHAAIGCLRSDASVTHAAQVAVCRRLSPDRPSPC